MKLHFILIIFCFTQLTYAQDMAIGLQASPSYKLQSIRNKTNGLTTSIGGYGFKAGIPIKFNLSNEKIFTTGILFEYFAFDNKINNTLLTSLRLNAIDIPLIYYYPLTDNFHLNAGGGLNYIFASKQLASGQWLNTTSIIRKIQPYAALGVSTNIDGNHNNYELGFSANYNLFSIWKTTSLTSTNLVGFNLNLKYYF